MNRVSVIVPVYNADSFLDDAVASALAQPETGEVLLIEDGSTDDSLLRCHRWRSKDNRVRLFRHGDHSNHGAAASRNLGLKNARCELICFLDADDFFLPGRFHATLAILDNEPWVDAVHEAMGVVFMDEAARREWDATRKGIRLSRLPAGVPPALIFECYALARCGRFATGGFTLRRASARRVGPFHTELRLSQDVEWFMRATAILRVAPGMVGRAVVMRRRHDLNRSMLGHAAYEGIQRRMLLALALWMRQRNIDPDRIQLVRRLLFSRCLHDYQHLSSGPPPTPDRRRAINNYLRTYGYWPQLLPVLHLLERCRRRFGSGSYRTDSTHPRLAHARKSQDEQPTVDVTTLIDCVIPAYKARAHLVEAITSVVTDDPWTRVVVVDDASPDNCLQLAMECADRWPGRISCLRHQYNQGAGPARSTGLRFSRAPLVTFLDADDRLLSGHLARCRRFLAQHTSFDGVCAPLCAVGGGRRDDWVDSGLYGIRFMPHRIPLLAALLCERIGLISLNGLVIRRSLLEQIGTFDRRLTLGQDQAWIMRSATVGRLGVIPLPGATYRRHTGNRCTRDHPAFATASLDAVIALWLWARQRCRPAARRLIMRGLAYRAWAPPIYHSKLNLRLRQICCCLRVMLILPIVTPPLLSRGLRLLARRRAS